MNSLKYLTLFGFALCLISFASTGCECEDLDLPVTDLDTAEVFRVENASVFIDPNNSLNIRVDFLNLLDTNTVQLNENFFISNWDPKGGFIQVTSDYIRIYYYNGQFCNPSCGIKITLKGDGNLPVQDLYGNRLDGDRDGSEGGDFIYEPIY